MNNETPESQDPPVPPQGPPGPSQDPPVPPQDPPGPQQDPTDSDTETEETNPDTNSDTSSIASNCCDDYPCPPQPEPEKCEPYYVPMTMQLCPVVKLYVNKPKVCLVNKAECIPCFLEKK